MSRPAETTLEVRPYLAGLDDLYQTKLKPLLLQQERRRKWLHVAKWVALSGPLIIAAGWYVSIDLVVVIKDADTAVAWSGRIFLAWILAMGLFITFGAVRPIARFKRQVKQSVLKEIAAHLSLRYQLTIDSAWRLTVPFADLLPNYDQRLSTIGDSFSGNFSGIEFSAVDAYLKDWKSGAKKRIETVSMGILIRIPHAGPFPVKFQIRSGNQFLYNLPEDESPEAEQDAAEASPRHARFWNTASLDRAYPIRTQQKDAVKKILTPDVSNSFATLLKSNPELCFVAYFTDDEIRIKLDLPRDNFEINSIGRRLDEKIIISDILHDLVAMLDMIEAVSVFSKRQLHGTKA